MTFTVFLDRTSPAFASDRVLIKAHERKDVETAATLLSEVRVLHRESQAEIETLQSSAAARGHAEGMAAVTDAFDAQIAGIIAAFDDFRKERRADIAAAAFAAVKAIIGATDDQTIVNGLVDASLARREGEAPVTIEVAPAVAERLKTHVADRSYVTVRSNETLGPADCVILSPQGRIVADLKVQLNALAERWGVTKPDGGAETDAETKTDTEYQA
jgi:flagellar biosynthesis/type III secretory pathway protein FliH